METVRNKIKVKFIEDDDIDENIKKQSNLTFNGIQNSDTNYDSYTFKQKEILLNKSSYIGFDVSD